MTFQQERIWNGMIARSFSPRQWFEEEDYPEDYGIQEDKIMWVYKRTGENIWTVGFYAPDKTWHTDSEYRTLADAAARVHWLNGGNQLA